MFKLGTISLTRASPPFLKLDLVQTGIREQRSRERKEGDNNSGCSVVAFRTISRE